MGTDIQLLTFFKVNLEVVAHLPTVSRETLTTEMTG